MIKSEADIEVTRPGLRRVLGAPMLVLYGLGVIIGAGIYVLVGTIVATAGGAAPWSFALAGILAALTGGAITFVPTVALPFISLVSVTSTITLLVFAGVNLALWRLHRSRPRTSGFRVPRFIPPFAALANLALVLAQAFIR